MSRHKLSPLRARKQDIMAFAEQAADELGYEHGEDMWGFVSRIGGRISFHEHLRPTAEDNPESIVVQEDGSFHIFLPTVTTAERDRFTIGHELGHLFLHFPKFKNKHPGEAMVATRRVDANDEEQQRAEWEANWFAAAFLMPETKFEEMHRQGKSCHEIARYFGVSSTAAEVRAKSLGL